MTLLFDGLALTRRLEANGSFTRPQAEALVDGLHDALVSGVATNHDLSDVKATLRAEIQDVKADLGDVKADVAVLRAEVHGKFNLLYWMFGVIVAALVALLLHAFMH